jgi:hypothetical protein
MTINEKRITNITGFAVFAVSTLVYLLTVAPTLLFWDCGEFIATSYIMGVPHPPGAPFYLMFGRIFSLLPFVDDIGLRVNLLSVFSSSFTVLFLYLSSVRLIKKWRGDCSDIHDVFIVHISSAVGALTFAFTYTFWFNAVEAEVYAFSMFFTSIIFWLTLVWTEKHENPDSSKYLLLIMLLVGLGTGVHLLNILTLPVSVYIMWYYNKRTAIITGLGVLISIMVLFAFPLDWKIYSLFIFLALTFVFQKMEDKEDVSLMFIMPLLLILGYSAYLMVYLRAGLNPPINENDPSNWQRMLAYLNREQYGDEAQLKNAVQLFFGEPNRKYIESLEKIGAAAGSADDPWKGHWTFFWKYQIVDMYIRYFNWQFIGMNISKMNRAVTLDGLYAIPFLMGLWGAIHHFFRDRKKAVALAALFIIMSLGLVIYQNQDYMQPRERDYFYVGSFFIFAIWIAMGIASIMEALKDEWKMKGLIAAVGIAAFTLPLLELKTNYFVSNRSGNYVAWDYSYNILNSCDENGILFTNGDNDTFPVWYLQEVEGIRKDVQVINLSLLNTGWYIRQLKKNIPDYIKYTEKQIDEYFDQHLMTSDGFMRRYWPEKRKLSIPTANGTGKVEWELGPTMHINVRGQREGFIKIQDQMVYEILFYNSQMNWKRPVYFAVTVGSSNFIGLDEWMRMDGLCFRVVDYKADKGIDPLEVYERILDRFVPAYRNLGDPSIYYDDNIQRLLQNYRSAFLQLALYYEEKDDSIPGREDDPSFDPKKLLRFHEFSALSPNDKKRYLLYKMEEYIPHATIPYSNEMVIAEIAGMYSDIGRKEEGLKLLSTVDLNTLSQRKKLRYVAYTSSRGYDDYAVVSLSSIFGDLQKIGSVNEKFERYFELYASFARIDDSKIIGAVTERILREMPAISDKTLMSVLFKEFGVLVYQGGDKGMAENVLEKYLTINRADTEAIDLLYQMHSISKNHEKALDAANRYLEVVPDDQKYLEIKTKLENERP